MLEIDGDLNLFAKTAEVVLDWNSRKLDPRVKTRTIVLAQYLAFVGSPCVITSIHHDRAIVGATGYSAVHAAWRAVDVRCSTLEAADAEAIREKMNRRFIYGLGGDGKPRDTIPPLDHGTAPHFHVQVPNKE